MCLIFDTNTEHSSGNFPEVRLMTPCLVSERSGLTEAGEVWAVLTCTRGTQRTPFALWCLQSGNCWAQWRPRVALPEENGHLPLNPVLQFCGKTEAGGRACAGAPRASDADLRRSGVRDAVGKDIFILITVNLRTL